MARQVLIVNVASPGLVYPTLALVAELARRGYEVTYVTSPPFAEEVASAGARVLPYRSRIAEVRAADVFAEPDDGARAHLLYLAENTAVLRTTRAYYRHRPAPDLVLYDDFPFIAGQILAARWDRPAVRLSAGFASNEHYSFAQDMIEASGVGSPLTLPAFRKRLTALLRSHRIGCSVEEFWYRTEQLNLVFIPRAFQIAGESFDDRYVFVGPCLADRAGAGDWRPKRAGRAMVLVSLGTTFNEHPEFFTECADAFAGLPWHVVMTVGEENVDKLAALPPNVEAHRWVPHLAVLRHARVCVTHGGMGTVMQALHWGRPIVAVPRSFDVVPMARRVAELGLGTLIEPAALDGQRLRDAVLALAADAALRRRVARFRRHIREAGGAVRAVDQIEARLGDGCDDPRLRRL